MWIWQVYMASLYGKIFWRVCLAGQYGGSNGLIYSKDLRARKHIVEQKERKAMYYGESVNCDIIM